MFVILEYKFTDMKFEEYLAKFDEILNAEVPQAPYDDEHFMTYVKLNQSRMNRWLKKQPILPEAREAFSKPLTPQKWIVIAEPWCGDACHIVPFMKLLTDLNPAIDFEVELRDEPPFRIEHYLTNGAKAVPKLIIQDANGNDLHTWGARPKAAQDFFMKLKADGVSMDEAKTELQNWYNKDAGAALQRELMVLI